MKLEDPGVLTEGTMESGSGVIPEPACTKPTSTARGSRSRRLVEGSSGPLDQSRPVSLSPHFWSKVLNAAPRTQWWVENREQPAEVGEPGGVSAVCSTLGASGLLSETPLS